MPRRLRPLRMMKTACVATRPWPISTPKSRRSAATRRNFPSRSLNSARSTKWTISVRAATPSSKACRRPRPTFWRWKRPKPSLSNGRRLSAMCKKRRRTLAPSLPACRVRRKSRKNTARSRMLQWLMPRSSSLTPRTTPRFWRRKKSWICPGSASWTPWVVRFRRALRP